MTSEAGRAVRGFSLRFVLQLTTLGLVAGLLALLVWRLVGSERGASLVSSVKHGKRPSAPAFTLPVIWSHPESWPRALRPAVRDGRISIDEAVLRR